MTTLPQAQAITLADIERLRESVKAQTLDPAAVIIFVGPNLAPDFVKLGMLPERYEHGRRYRSGDYEIAVHPLIPGREAVATPAPAAWAP